MNFESVRRYIITPFVAALAASVKSFTNWLAPCESVIVIPVDVLQSPSRMRTGLYNSVTVDAGEEAFRTKFPIVSVSPAKDPVIVCGPKVEKLSQT